MAQQIGVTNLAPLLDGPDAMRHLQKLQGIGPVTAARIKKAWDRERHLLPDSALQPVSQAATSAAAPVPPSEMAWDASTRCYAPDMYRAEATVASMLAHLAAQPQHEPPGTASLSGSERVQRWMDTNERQTGMTHHWPWPLCSPGLCNQCVSFVRFPH